MLHQLLDRSKLKLLLLRGVSIIAKFLFTSLYFRYSEAGFGEYSLIATTILLLVFLLGMDFYSYANRAILEPGSNPQKIIFNQFSLYFILYVLLSPVVYLIFNAAGFNPDYLPLFFLVLITEHLNFEFYRLLFVFKNPLAANLNLFFRNAFWVLAASLWLFVYDLIDVKTVLWFWLAGDLLALLFSLGISWTKRHKISLQSFKLDKQWIIKGLVVSLPYILGSLAYKTIEFSDRYLIDYFLDKHAVGVYAFFSNMANVLNIILFTLVISVLYPGLVESIMHKKQNEFKRKFKQFRKEIFIYGIATGVMLLVLLPLVLYVIGKTQYDAQLHIFILLVLSNMALNFSFLYHFVIYAFRKDWRIFKATALAALLNIVLNWFLIPVWGIAGAAIATLASFVLIAVLKYFDANKLLMESIKWKVRM